ncbi:histidine kinase,HAMP domain-containing protein,histidine kinase [Rivularia sp. PCC 7116]|uniref:sensor histidine kinase n=1 Tax=Rivularia sp. PCC 7116 TaxID=373994 RepID=UPI00029EE6E2|nr:ATP-binding protein [Rivularia sp. PCC 7116]AFY57164.1 histidine kinase,HAMP domain-containing protein,histidine kinase [Rivularia sp. PCC 7116]
MTKCPENKDKSSSLPISWFHRLSIARKIGFGYAIAIGVGVLGTVTGTFIGDYFQYQAGKVERLVDEEVELFNELKSAVLQARIHQQQFIYLLEKPQELQKEFVNFIEDESDAKEGWEELESFNDQIAENKVLDYTQVVSFLQTYDGVQEEYFEEVDKLIAQIDAPNLKSPSQIQTARKLLLDFTNSSVALKFDAISHELNELAEAAEEEDERADAALAQAQETRRFIVLSTNSISILLAILLAYYTTKTITLPIIKLTDIAEETTRNSNFDLQAPVTTRDEIGILAISLNQLIIRVKNLLKEQAEGKEKLELYNLTLERKVKQRTEKLATTLKELQYTQAQLIQQEKMSSLGQLVAGIAHEINNPANFIHGNLEYTKDYLQDLLNLVELYQSEYPNPTEIIEKEIQNIELEFLQEDLPKILDSMQTGSERIREIVKSLRTFSRLDEADYKKVDIHESIESTLMIIQSRLKANSERCEIKVVKNYDKLPLIECYAGQLNQVFLNLLFNAIDVIEEKINKTNNSPFLAPQISISTKLLNFEQIAIYIADNGLGMTEEIREKIFNPFFTTKPVGKGTGLGLAVSYQVVVDKHHGELNCSSTPGEGTEFAIAIPVSQELRSKGVRE